MRVTCRSPSQHSRQTARCAPLDRSPDTPKPASSFGKLAEDKAGCSLDTVLVRITSERAVDIESGLTPASHGARQSSYAWIRLFVALLLSSIGGVGMWSVIVALPAIQTEFGVARSAASLPYTMTMICFGFGGILMGRLSDRFGIMVPAVGGALSLGLGYALASQATSLWQFIAAQGLLVGVGSSVAFAPLIADTSLWFASRRGMAVARAVIHPERGLARDVSRHRDLLRGDHVAAHAVPPAAVAAHRVYCGNPWVCVAIAAPVGNVSGRPPNG